MELHATVGDVLLALVLFRLGWGFFGAETARFSSFFASPRTTVRHLARMLKPESDRQIGHNPAGGWSVIFLLMLLLGETLSGLYVLNDVAQVGPLTDSVPSRIANMIDAMHSLIWRVMLAGI